MKKISRLAAAAAMCISLSAAVQIGVSADNTYNCDLSSLAADGQRAEYGTTDSIITIDDYTTAYLTYEGTYAEADGRVYLKSGTVCNKDGSYASGSYIAFTAPMNGTISITGADIGWFEENTYKGYGSKLTISASTGTTYYLGYRKPSTYVSGISFTPSEGYGYIDFDDLANTEYGTGSEVISLDANTAAYLTYEGTNVDENGILHLTSEKSGKGTLENRSYIEFTAPSAGTIAYEGNYLNYYLNGVYKTYANNYSAAVNAGDKIQIAARDSSRSTLSRITFVPYYGSYVFADNKVNLVGSDAYSTVIIYKDGDMKDEDIVYIGQAQGRFSAAATFALKKDPEDGKYIVWLGGNNEKKSEFYIGMRLNESVSVKCDEVFTDENVPGTVAFGWKNVEPASYKSVLVKLDDVVYGFGFDGPTISGEGVSLGVEINGLEAFTSAEAYLSPLGMDEASNTVNGGN